MAGSMSIGLVFVWSDGPDGLEGEVAGRRATSDLRPRVLRSKLDPLAFPQGQRRNHLPNDQSGIGPLHVVVAQAGDPALPELVGGADVVPEVSPAGPREFLSERIQLTSQRPFAVQRLRGRSPRQPEVDPAHLGAQALARVRAVQTGAAELHVGGPGELPEIQQMHEIARPPAAAEQGVRLAARRLGGDLVRAQAAERAVQRDPRSGEAVSTEVAAECERVFGLGERVQVPAVQFAELLPELSDVEPDVSGQARPIGVPLLDAHVTVLEAHEDLGARVGIERRLEADLELPWIEVVMLDARLLPVGAHVPRDADFGVELRLAALAADELGGAGRVGPDP